MTDEEFAAILTLGHEISGVELKGPAPLSDRVMFPRIVRAVLGMSNRRDGGEVVIGVEEAGNSLNPVGLNDDDLATWTYDHIADALSGYADPSVSFDIEVKEYQGNKYVILHVREFEDIPILCNKDYSLSGNIVLRKGACYVRSRRKPETTEIPTQEDMRALLDLAIDKGVRRFIERSVRTGTIILLAITTPSDQELFDEQLEDLG